MTVSGHRTGFRGPWPDPFDGTLGTAGADPDEDSGQVKLLPPTVPSL